MTPALRTLAPGQREAAVPVSWAVSLLTPPGAL